MKINTKVRYGLRAMIEIATANNSEGILLKDIAKSQNISNKYLDPIIASLILKGLISTVNGKRSGYRLSRSAQDISMLDIYTAFEPIIIVDCVDNSNFCTRSCDCCAKEYWDGFKTEFVEMLSKKKLAQIICETAKS